MSQPSIFTRVMRGDIPADLLYQDDLCIVIRDIQPRAPVHLLVIPRDPIPRLVDAVAGHQDLLGHLMLVAAEMARREGVGDGFRLIVNNGEGAGQTVFHLHLHVLGNKKFNENDMDA
jgi:histidine triad (HIT) family protein